MKTKLMSKLKSNKVLALATTSALLSSQAFAAGVSYDETSGFTGSIDLTAYYQVGAIVLVALATMFGFKKAMSLIR